MVSWISGVVAWQTRGGTFIANSLAGSCFSSVSNLVGIKYLRILALSQMFMALEIVFEGSFAGAGNTVPPMIVSIFGSLARILLAYLLAVHWGIGITGVWWAISSTSIAKGILLTYLFSRDRWKTQRI